MSEILVIIRPSFMKFCQDGCRAALFNHILYWIAKKTKDQPRAKVLAGEITYYATSEELVEQMAGAWGVCKVRKEVNALIDMGIIGRGHNPEWGVDRTKHFFFGKEQCAKLIELCQKHQICLSHIGLSPEIGQMINLSNASDKSIKCLCSKQMINLSLASDKSIGTITKDSTKDSKTKDTERKYEPSGQTSNVSAQEESFIHPPTQSSFSSLSEEVTKTYNLICQELYPNCYPELTTKAIEHFTKLSSSIKTIEDIKSLVAYCRQEQPILNTSKIHPGNLVRWLDGWTQSRPVVAEQVAEEPEYVVTDEELAEEVFRTARYYRDDANFEEHLKYIERFKRDFKLNNYDLCDKIAAACRKAQPDESDMGDFFYHLRCTVM